jgi:hypothetical protein
MSASIDPSTSRHRAPAAPRHVIRPQRERDEPRRQHQSIRSNTPKLCLLT